MRKVIKIIKYWRPHFITLTAFISFPRSRVVMHTKVNSWAKAVKSSNLNNSFHYFNGITTQLSMLWINPMHYHAGAWEWEWKFYLRGKLIDISNRNLYDSEVGSVFRRSGSIGASNNKKASELLAFLLRSAGVFNESRKPPWFCLLPVQDLDLPGF